MTDTPTPERLTCPDGGACHHECQPDGRCWRVDNAGPLSGVYEGDRWPDTPTPDHPAMSCDESKDCRCAWHDRAPDDDYLEPPTPVFDLHTRCRAEHDALVAEVDRLRAELDHTDDPSGPWRATGGESTATVIAGGQDPDTGHVAAFALSVRGKPAPLHLAERIAAAMNRDPLLTAVRPYQEVLEARAARQRDQAQEPGA